MGVTTWGCATGIWWVEARAAGKHCVVHRTVPTAKICRAQNAAQAETPRPKRVVHHVLGMRIQECDDLHKQLGKNSVNKNHYDTCLKIGFIDKVFSYL